MLSGRASLGVTRGVSADLSPMPAWRSSPEREAIALDKAAVRESPFVRCLNSSPLVPLTRTILRGRFSGRARKLSEHKTLYNKPLVDTFDSRRGHHGEILPALQAPLRTCLGRAMPARTRAGWPVRTRSRGGGCRPLLLHCRVAQMQGPRTDSSPRAYRGTDAEFSSSGHDRPAGPVIGCRTLLRYGVAVARGP